MTFPLPEQKQLFETVEQLAAENACLLASNRNLTDANNELREYLDAAIKDRDHFMQERDALSNQLQAAVSGDELSPAYIAGYSKGKAECDRKDALLKQALELLDRQWKCDSPWSLEDCQDIATAIKEELK